MSKNSPFNYSSVVSTGGGGGTGDVVGPASSTDNALARYNLATGKLIQNSGVLLDDSNNLSGIANLSLSGNQTFSGVGKKILADFSNATRANRLALQTSTLNGNTRVPLLPNGTSRLAGIDCFDGTDADNASFLQVHSDGTNNHAGLNSAKIGTGTTKDLVFQIDSVTKAKINAADGKFNVDTLTPSQLVLSDSSKNLKSSPIGLGVEAALGKDLGKDNGSLALNGLPEVTEYLGQVATGCYLPSTLFNTRFQWFSRSPHISRDSVTSLKIVLPGFYVATTEALTGVNTTYTASIEYPEGTYTQVLFSGSATGICTDGSMLTSDFCNVSIPKGVKFWVRIFGQNANGCLFLGSTTINTQNGALLSWAISGMADITMGGTIANNSTSTPTTLFDAVSTTYSFYPAAILANTKKQSFYILGDSRGLGISDRFSDASCDIGNVGRSIGKFAAYINGSRSGDSLAGFIASRTNRMILANYCSKIILQSNFNDLNGGASVATVKGYLQTIAGYFPTKSSYLCTCEPTSTVATVSITALISVGVVCTATVASTAGLIPGQLITIAGATPTTYNGNYFIQSILSATQFTYIVYTAPASSPATGTITYKDCWTSQILQTINSTVNAKLTEIDNWKRALPSGFANYLEISDVVTSGRDSGKWGWASKGSLTGDGVHCFPIANEKIRDSGAISPDKFI
jgi:hypothetical protein